MTPRLPKPGEVIRRLRTSSSGYPPNVWYGVVTGPVHGGAIHYLDWSGGNAVFERAEVMALYCEDDTLDDSWGFANPNSPAHADIPPGIWKFAREIRDSHAA